MRRKVAEELRERENSGRAGRRRRIVESRYCM
jgi:hypothetical protein